MNFKSFFFLHFFSLFSFPRIFIQIFQEPNIGALLIEMLYLLLVLALFGSSLSQFSKFFLWICNLNWPWSFKYHLLPIHSPPASCLKKKKKKKVPGPVVNELELYNNTAKIEQEDISEWLKHCEWRKRKSFELE